MASSTVPSACLQVINTPELLELILVGFVDRPYHLVSSGPWSLKARDLRNLLRIQRVNKAIQTAVASTPSLQRALGFRAMEPQRALAVGEVLESSAIAETMNFLLVGRRIRITRGGAEVKVHDIGYRGNFNIGCVRGKGDGSGAEMVAGSWQRMLIMQPPWPLRIGWDKKGWSESCRLLEGELECGRAMTLGEVVEVFLEWEVYELKALEAGGGSVAKDVGYSGPVVSIR